MNHPPRDVVHRIVTGHWPRWAPHLWLYPGYARRCRECGVYEIRKSHVPKRDRK